MFSDHDVFERMRRRSKKRKKTSRGKKQFNKQMRVESLEERVLLDGAPFHPFPNGMNHPDPVVRQALMDVTTTGTPDLVFSKASGEVGSNTAQSGPLINIDDFRNDPLFAGIDGSGTAVAILDTGIDLDHPFFGPDADNNGVADRIVFNQDFIGIDPNADDVDGHGSNVSSIALSQDATFTGMAPGADIIALQVLNDFGFGSLQAIEQALQFVAANVATYNIAAVNMSLGLFTNDNTPQLSPLSDELAAIAAQDVIIASSSGNDFATFNSVQGVGYPSSDPNSLSVGAVYDADVGFDPRAGGAQTGPDRITGFSQRHSTLTSIFAPGAPITGAAPGGGTSSFFGTSQASPHIAGIAALMQQLVDQNVPGTRLNNAQFEALLQSTAEIINDGDDEVDAVTNTGLDFPRVDVHALAQEIVATIAPPTPPEIEVTGNGMIILDGDATPDLSDNTDLGAANVNNDANGRQFFINNLGGMNLDINNVTITGANASDFSLVALTPSFTVGGFSSMAFEISFDPSAAGVRNATIEIPNNDSDENPYTFSIRGLGFEAPEIAVVGNGKTITDGDTSPRSADHTDFGFVSTGSSLQRTFRIDNLGSGATNLNLNSISLVPVFGSGFALSTNPAPTSLAAGGSADLVVTFAPTTAAFSVADISIANNDTDEDPYTFRIQAQGISGQLDFGDAPDVAFGNTQEYGIAGHVIDPTSAVLGGFPDAESPQGDETALLDDTTGSDDEDGVIFGPLASFQIARGQSNEVVITVSGAADSTALFNLWIDYDADGFFDEQSLDDIPILIGPTGTSVITIPFAVPEGATLGPTYARARISSQANLDSKGLAQDGEVEDYRIEIVEAIDFGDAPLSYGVAQHTISRDANGVLVGPALGSLIDGEPASLASANSDGDDLDNRDDEDGVIFSNNGVFFVGATSGGTATLTVAGAADGRVDAWIDFNGDGDFLDPGERITPANGTFVLANSNAQLTVIDPGFAVPGTTSARFRISTTGGLSPDGTAPDGEVEDYQIQFVNSIDFGDAPEDPSDPLPDYNTTTSNNGARHAIVANGPRLGSFVDPEVDGTPSVDAQGDDNNGTPDDEDGVVFLTDLLPDSGVQWFAGQTASIRITIEGAPGHVHAWIDSNRDGDFDNKLIDMDQPGQQFLGTQVFSFIVPETAAPGENYLRVRVVSQAGNVDPFGFEPDGEVEDHSFEIVGLDFGDLPSDNLTGTGPNDYNTVLATNGARHAIRGPALGNLVDQEPDGHPSSLGSSDDTDKLDDEDGVFDGLGNPLGSLPLSIGSFETFQVVTTRSSGFIDAFIDFNRDGDFNDLFDGPQGSNSVSEKIINSVAVGPGTTNFQVFIPVPTGLPGGPQMGITGARFRVTSNGGFGPDGFASDGEVEDYQVNLQFDSPLDFGDAPDKIANGGSATSPDDVLTLLVNNGARHVITQNGPILGQIVDAETDGLPTSTALGDDNDNQDDEDGIVFVTRLLTDSQATIEATVTNADGYLNAYLDADDDGVFEEQLIDNAFIRAGETKSLDFFVPLFFSTDWSGVQILPRIMRFRLSTVQNLPATGPAPDGEVEDYRVNLELQPIADYGDAPDTGLGTGVGDYKTTFLDGGPVHAAANWAPHFGTRVQAVNNPLPNTEVDNEVDAHASTDGTGDDAINDFTGNNFIGAVFPRPDEGLNTEIRLGNNAGGLAPAFVWYAGQEANLFADTSAQHNTNVGFFSHQALPGTIFSHPTARLNNFDSAVGQFWMDTDRDGDFDNLLFEELFFYPNDGRDSTGPPVRFPVPGTATPGVSFVRARISYFGNLLPDGAYPAGHTNANPFAQGVGFGQSTGFDGLIPTGEVEDLMIEIRQLDFGDAPDLLAGTGPGDYNTIVRQSSLVHQFTGPSHEVDLSGPRLGLLLDGDADGQPNSDATGDDLDSVDSDEDGVSFSNVVAGLTGTATIQVTGAVGHVDGWVDFNGDGNFAANEQIIDTLAGNNGPQFGLNETRTISFNVPGDAITGATFARFRVSRNGNLGPDGFAGETQDGEVEDMQIIIQGLDYGDLQDDGNAGTNRGDYTTLLVNDGPRHVIVGPTLGSGVPDAESDARVSVGANGDDTTNFDDENGVIPVINGLRVGRTRVAFNVTVGNENGRVDGWVDFNMDGDFDDLGEKIVDSLLISHTNTSPTPITVAVPQDALVGLTGARFRVSSGGGLSPTGLGNNGEVEDYLVQVGGIDFGDAPDPTTDTSGPGSNPATLPNYRTRLNDGGPRHEIGGPRLGDLADAELDAALPLDGTGDDATNQDDEDGVTFVGTLFEGQPGTVQVKTTNADGVLNAWIDFNQDGDFNDAGEQIALNQAVTASPNPISLGFPVPSVAAGTRLGQTVARFRVSSTAGLGPAGVLPNGQLPNGEVEDHLVTVGALDFGDAPNTYRTLAASDGPRHALGGPILEIQSIPLVVPNPDPEVNGLPSVLANGDDTSGVDDEDGILINGSGSNPILIGGQQATVMIGAQNITAGATVQGWFDIDFSGTFETTEELITQTFTSNGTVLVNVDIPDNIFGVTYARFRISTAGNLLPTGAAPDGEVEDYVFTIEPVQPEFDFGDAPDPPYATLETSGGAQHAFDAAGPILGTLIDVEPIAQANADATGDDADGVDDEDGVRFPIPTLTPGSTASALVTVGNANGTLGAWVDFNQDGDFDDAGEEIFKGAVSSTSIVPRLFGTARVNATLNRIVEFDRNGAILREFAVPTGEQVGIQSGLAFDGTFLWYIEGASTSDTLYKIDTTQTDPASGLPGLVVDSYVMSSNAFVGVNLRYEGLTFLNNKVYLLDSQSNSIFEFDPGTETITNTLSLSLANPGVAPRLIGGLAAIAAPDRLVSASQDPVDPTLVTVYEIDPATGVITTTTGPIDLPEALSGLAVSGSQIFLGSLDSNIAIHDRSGLFVDSLSPDPSLSLRSLGAGGTQQSQTNTIQIDYAVPATAALGNTIARYRITTDTDLGPTGLENDGEVEDYEIEVIGAAGPTATNVVQTSSSQTQFSVSLEPTDAAGNPLTYTAQIVQSSPGGPSGSADSSAEQAYWFDQNKSLSFSGDYYENWGGLNEKWVQGSDGWYFITPDGNLFKYDSASFPVNPQVATLTPAHHADPSLLHNASQPAAADPTVVAQRAYDLDQQIGLFFTGDYYENYYGANERWLNSNDGWHFVRPDGTVWKWDGTSAGVDESTLVTVLTPEYFNEPWKLYNAQPPVGAQSSSVAQRAYDLDQQRGLSFTGDYYEGFYGANERWLLGNDGWYFIKPDGTVWQWDGNPGVATSTQVETLTSDYYNDPSRLYDALPVGAGITGASTSVSGHMLGVTLPGNQSGELMIELTADDGSITTTYMLTVIVNP